MPRGGARPGAGRKPKNGVAAKRPRAKSKAYTAPNGEKTADAPKDWPFGRQPAEPEAPPPADEPKMIFASPLEYWQHVLADPLASKSEKSAAAYSMAPYVHARIAPAAKKEEAKSKSKTAAGGKFKAAPAPLKLVRGA